MVFSEYANRAKYVTLAKSSDPRAAFMAAVLLAKRIIFS